MSFFSSSGFVIVNREVARKIGINEAILLYELVRLSEHYKNLNQYQTFDGIDGYFFQTIEHLEKWTVLTREQQDKAFKKLSSLNFVEKILKGLPAKRYFKINETEVIKYLFLDCVKDTNFVVGNTQQYKNKDIKNKDSNNITIINPCLPRTSSAREEEIPLSSNNNYTLSSLNISDSLRKELLASFDEEKLKVIVNRTLKWEGRNNDEVGVRMVIKNFDNWKDVVSREDRVNNNRQLLKKIKHLDMRRIGDAWTIIIGDYYFEIVSHAKSYYHSIEDKNFEEKVNELLQQLEENNENK